MPPDKRVPPRFGRLIDDFIVLAAGQVVSKIFGFLAFALLARKLTVEDYGAVETAVGMAAIGAVALELGTGAVGVRRIAQKECSPANVLGSVISARLVVAVVAAPALALFYVVMTKSEASDGLFWLYAASLFAIPFNHNWFFQSRERMTIAGFGQTLKMGAFLVLIILFAPGRNGVAHVAYAELMAAGLMASWYSVLAFRALQPMRPHYSLAAGGVLLRESAPLGTSAFVNALAQYLPVLIVATVANDVETAKFGAAQRLLLSLITFSFVYYFNLYPLIARRLVDNPEALRRLLSASVRVTAWAGVLLAAMLWALAPLIMRLIFGKDFESAGSEFGILAWSGALILASGNARWLLVAGNRQGSLLVAQLANAGIVIGFCFVLTPIFGSVGAALACNLGALALWIVAHLRTRGLTVRPSLAGNLPAAFAALAVIAALTILQPNIWSGVAIAVAIVGSGMALDRRFPASLRELANAKSAS